MSLSVPKFYNQPLYNAGSEKIPPFAVVEIKSPGFISYKDKEWFQVGKPSSDGKMYLLNGPFEIGTGGSGASRTGKGANPCERVGAFALYDPAIDPKTNDALAPIADRWWLGKESGADDPPPGSDPTSETTAKGSFLVIGDPKGEGAAPPGFPAAASTKRVRVWMPGASAPQTSGYGLLIKDVPAALIMLSSTAKGIQPGYADAAVIPLEWQMQSVQDSLLAVEGDDSAALKLPALNPIWTEIIKASETVRGAVIVTGSRETRNVYETGNPSKKEVWIIDNVIYPVTIIKGVTQQTVSGGDFMMTVGEVLWGRRPEETQIMAKNPDNWTGNNGAYALAMRRTDGLWQAIDLAC